MAWNILERYDSIPAPIMQDKATRDVSIYNLPEKLMLSFISPKRSAAPAYGASVLLAWSPSLREVSIEFAL